MLFTPDFRVQCQSLDVGRAGGEELGVCSSSLLPLTLTAQDSKDSASERPAGQPGSPSGCLHLLGPYGIGIFLGCHPGEIGITPPPILSLQMNPQQSLIQSQSHRSHSFILSLKQLLLTSNHVPGSGPGSRKCEQRWFNVMSTFMDSESDCLASKLTHNSCVAPLKLLNLSVPQWRLQ